MGHPDLHVIFEILREVLLKKCRSTIRCYFKGVLVINVTEGQIITFIS